MTELTADYADDADKKICDKFVRIRVIRVIRG